MRRPFSLALFLALGLTLAGCTPQSATDTAPRQPASASQSPQPPAGLSGWEIAAWRKNCAFGLFYRDTVDLGQSAPSPHLPGFGVGVLLLTPLSPDLDPQTVAKTVNAALRHQGIAQAQRCGLIGVHDLTAGTQHLAMRLPLGFDPARLTDRSKYLAIGPADYAMLQAAPDQGTASLAARLRDNPALRTDLPALSLDLTLLVPLRQ